MVISGKTEASFTFWFSSCVLNGKLSSTALLLHAGKSSFSTSSSIYSLAICPSKWRSFIPSKCRSVWSWDKKMCINMLPSSGHSEGLHGKSSTVIVTFTPLSSPNKMSMYSYLHHYWMKRRLIVQWEGH